MDQSIITRAVNIATKNALSGHPVKDIIWVPPVNASSNPKGVFIIEACGSLNATDTMPWEKGE